jgi:hypothetical protein
MTTQETMPVWIFWLMPKDAKKATTLAWWEARLLPESTWYVLEGRWTDQDGREQRETLATLGRELYPARLPEQKVVDMARFELGLAGYSIMADGPALPTGQE